DVAADIWPPCEPGAHSRSCGHVTSPVWVSYASFQSGTRSATACHARLRNPVMSRLVMKFGGTSVADIERIRNVARHVKREADAGHEVAVVVSAMAGTTNRLVEWCGDASQLH